MFKFSWIKNTSGEPDAVLTLAVTSLVVILLKVLMFGISFKIGSRDFNLGTIDPSTIGAILTPTLGAYVVRRYTSMKFGSDKPDSPVEPAKESDPTEKKEA